MALILFSLFGQVRGIVELVEVVATCSRDIWTWFLQWGSGPRLTLISTFTPTNLFRHSMTALEFRAHAILLNVSINLSTHI